MWATTTCLLPSPGGTAGRAKTEGAGATLPAYAEPDSFVCFFFSLVVQAQWVSSWSAESGFT